MNTSFKIISFYVLYLQTPSVYEFNKSSLPQGTPLPKMT